ncbi:MAG: hypothetical protein Q7T05_04615, partial [Dehalococcoidia bacterium]|nr:hypothetical protein [Dehalococcoidia bacterium]
MFRTLIVNMKDKADAAFGKPEVYEYLVPGDIGYAIRLPANEVLQYCIRHLLRQPVGRPSNKPIVRPRCMRQGATACQNVSHAYWL